MTDLFINLFHCLKIQQVILAIFLSPKDSKIFITRLMPLAFSIYVIYEVAPVSLDEMLRWKSWKTLDAKNTIFSS